ncbi:MLO-like protein 1 [Pyrus communis]|uniref:MLO-like protein 1 n=1 Tax=Pyrus communis TaxID=23211 RepID=UPI0035C25821
MSAGESEEGKTLEFTPTWVVAAVCMVIVALSLAAERFLHYGGKFLKRKNQMSLYEALQKIKEELMLMGFISLLLTVFQNLISKFCVSEDVMAHLLPCKLPGEAEEAEPTSHLGGMRRLFAEEGRRRSGTAPKNTRCHCCRSKLCTICTSSSSSSPSSTSASALACHVNHSDG